MSDQLKQYLDNVFSRYEDLKPLAELKEELFHNLQEKLNDLKSDGYDDETALQLTIGSIGEISELVESISADKKQLQQIVGMNLSMSNMRNSDLRGVKVHDGKFNYSNLRSSDFSDADLTDGHFKCSNLEYVNFDRSILLRTRFVAANLRGASFTDSVLDSTDFSYSNLSGICFDGLSFHGTVFNNAGLKGTSFKNATFINVSFKTQAKRAIFDGAVMDKLTYAILQGHGAKLQNVTIV